MRKYSVHHTLMRLRASDNFLHSGGGIVPSKALVFQIGTAGTVRFRTLREPVFSTG
jgi:hypothetical protein